MILYADGDALELWLDDTLDDDPAPLLRKASRLVGAACRNDCYDTQSNGLPADDDLREAMSDAVCAQVEVWLAAGVDPVAGDASLVAAVTASSVDGGSVTFDATAVQAVTAAKSAAVQGLCEDAFLILRDAGLASATV